MFGRSIDRQKAGRVIRAATLSQLADGVDLLSRLRVGYGLVQETVAGIMTIRVSTALSTAKCLLVSTGGITAFNTTTLALGFGTVRVYTTDTSTTTYKLVDTGVDLVVYNNIPSTLTPAIAAGKWGQLKVIDGLPFIDVAGC